MRYFTIDASEGQWVEASIYADKKRIEFAIGGDLTYEKTILTRVQLDTMINSLQKMREELK